ncbi:ADP-ribosyltransferase [Sinorhizobium fredii]|uniref:ADP-ribosyltransferase n=1 Tax=Rhizobium fredii TaxID=380 RepID=UPI0030A0B7D7
MRTTDEMVALKAFVTLERSLAVAVGAHWDVHAEKVVTEILPLVEAGHFEEAHGLANYVSMNGLAAEQRERLEEMAVSALLFGAHQVTGSVRRTSFARGDQELPFALQQALDQFVAMVEVNGAEIVRNQLHQAIDAVAQRAKDAAINVTKADNLADRLNAAVLGTGRAVVDIGANLTTSRLVTLGFLSEAMVHEIDTYQVNEVLDDRICPVCRYMHGKTFDVVHEHGRVLAALGTMDPKELKSSAPWPGQSRDGLKKLYDMSAQELQSAGYGSPPYHPLCRGVLVLAGTVNEVIPLGSRRQAPVLDPLLDGTKGPAEAGGIAASSVEEVVQLIAHRTPSLAELEHIQPVTDVTYAKWGNLIRETMDFGAFEYEAASIYQGSDYVEINRHYRRGDRRPSSFSLEHEAALDNVIARSELPYDVRLYRGVENFRGIFNVGELEELLDDTLPDLGYMSTSSSARVARSFAGRGESGVFEIFARKGQRAMHFGSITSGYEQEFLWPRGTRMKVLKVERAGTIEDPEDGSVYTVNKVSVVILDD